MNDFGLGIHHLSVGDLPQDPTKSFNGFIDRKLEIRDEISNHVKEAQKLIITKIEELRNISFSSWLRKDFSVKLVKGVESRWGSC